MGREAPCSKGSRCVSTSPKKIEQIENEDFVDD